MAYMCLRHPIWQNVIALDAVKHAKELFYNSLAASFKNGSTYPVSFRNYSSKKLLNIRPNSITSMSCRPFSRREPSEVSWFLDYFDRRMREFDKLFRHFPPFSFPRVWDRDIPIATALEGNQNYRIDLDLRDFKPEDIKVTVRDRLLTVEARTEVKNSDGSKVYREYNHQSILPEEVLTESVRSLLNENGTLTIEGLLKAIEPPQPKEIPVHKETPDKEK